MTQISGPQTADPTANFAPLQPSVHHEPQRVADDVFLIRQLQGEGRAPMCMYINSLVIDGSEPVIVDTGTRANRQEWLEDVFAIVRPDRVRWVFLTHDDVDHTGNLVEVLRRCPNAVLVTSWLMTERLTPEFNFPLARMRWVDDGDHFEAGDRTIVALRPPTFDAPTTRGVFDTRSRVYYASDSFGAVVPHHVDKAGDLAGEAWKQGLVGFNSLLSPWAAIADPVRFADRVKAVQSLAADAIATCHGPVITGTELGFAYQTMSRLPELSARPLFPMPGQGELEAMVAALTGEQHGGVEGSNQ
jgi:flavorubredoxin